MNGNAYIPGSTWRGGTSAARVALAAMPDGSADAVYERAAGYLGLYGVAFFGWRGTPNQRRQLATAWRVIRAARPIGD